MIQTKRYNKPDPTKNPDRKETKTINIEINYTYHQSYQPIETTYWSKNRTGLKLKHKIKSKDNKEEEVLNQRGSGHNWKIAQEKYKFKPSKTIQPKI